MRRLLLTTLLIAAPTLAHATDIYVSPSGSGSTCSSGSPCSLDHANQSARAGDRVILQSGTYSTAIAPDSSGHSNTSRITYMSANLTASSVTITPLVQLTKNYVTIKGITCSDALQIRDGADHDSVAASVLNGGCFVWDSDHCMIARNVIGGERFSVLHANASNDTSDALNWCEADSVYDNTISTVTSTSGDIMMEFHFIRNLMFVRNHCTMVSHSGYRGSSGVKQYHVIDSRFIDNYWSVTTDCAGDDCDEAGYCVIRDRSYRNLYLRDTLLVASNGNGVSVRLNHGGELALTHTEFNNNFESCFFKNSAGPIEYSDGIEADTLLNNVFVATGNALRITGTEHTNDAATSLIEHNTFVTLGDDVFFGAFGLQRFGPWDGELVVRNNIFYSSDTTTVDTDLGMVGPFGAGVYYPSGDDFNGNLATLDDNLYWNRGLSPISSYYTGGAYRRRAIPQWYADSGYDQHSLGAFPFFTDSALASFDARMLPGTAAIGGSWPDGYVGAKRYPPPGTVTDLSLAHGKNSIAVSWTAPGADGSAGQATQYDLRMSISAINDGNFYGATRVTTGVPAPSEAGTAECVTVTGLSQCQTYYFALKTIDDLNITSAISNSPSTTTNCSGSAQVTCGMSRVVAGDEDDLDAIGVFQLTIASSNPVADRAMLRCAIPPQGVGARLDLGVFDVAGRQVRTLDRSVAQAGIHMVTWDLRDGAGNRVHPGLYFVRGRNGSTQITRTLVVQ